MKRLGAILIVLILAISAAAASVDISLAAGGRATYGQLDWDTTTENGARYNFSIDAELDMDFGKGQGMLVGILLSMNDIDLSIGYAYQTDISSNCDFILGAGAIIGLNPAVSLDYFVTADFDFYISQDMYIRLGTGIITNFGKLDENYATKPKFIFPLPSIGFGWDF